MRFTRLLFSGCLSFGLSVAEPALAERVLYDLSGPCTDAQLLKMRVQAQRGEISCDIPFPNQPEAIRFEAGGKTDTVGKSAFILPFAPQGQGVRLKISADVFIPEGTDPNSLILIDVECKNCGAEGNPGLRMYLRDGGLRIDRKKIGERHAWAMPAPPLMGVDEWHRIDWQLDLGANHATGRSQVALNNFAFLINAGRTLPIGTDQTAVDRVQIGLTANSNPGLAAVYMRNIRVTVDP